MEKRLRGFFQSLVSDISDVTLDFIDSCAAAFFLGKSTFFVFVLGPSLVSHTDASQLRYAVLQCRAYSEFDHCASGSFCRQSEESWNRHTRQAFHKCCLVSSAGDSIAP